MSGADRPAYRCCGTVFPLCPQDRTAGLQVLYGPAEIGRALFLSAAGEHLPEIPLLHHFPSLKNIQYILNPGGTSCSLRMLRLGRKSQKLISSPGEPATTRGGITMLSNETVRKLHEMRLGVMAEAFSAQLKDA